MMIFANCARVAWPCGSSMLSPTPLTTPFAAAQRMAGSAQLETFAESLYALSAATSVFQVLPSLCQQRNSMVTISSRVTFCSGLNVPSS